MNAINCNRPHFPIMVTAGGLAAITGIFITLAAFQVLPNGVNAISNLGQWGIGIGGTLIGSGSLFLVGGVIGLVRQNLLEKSSREVFHHAFPDAKPLAQDENASDRIIEQFRILIKGGDLKGFKEAIALMDKTQCRSIYDSPHIDIHQLQRTSFLCSVLERMEDHELNSFGGVPGLQMFSDIQHPDICTLILKKLDADAIRAVLNGVLFAKRAEEPWLESCIGLWTTDSYLQKKIPVDDLRSLIFRSSLGKDKMESFFKTLSPF